MRLSVECAFPELRKRGAVSRKSAFWVCGLTEKHTLGGESHGKAHSGRLESRKSAFCEVGVTEKHILRVDPHGKTHSEWGVSRKSAFWSPLVGQSAPFRETKLQTEICEPSRNPPRSLAGGLPHTSWAPRRDGKAHSGAVRHLAKENRVLATDYP